MFSLGLKEHEDVLQDLPWPAQSPDLHITVPLRSVLESRVRSRLPPPPSLKQLQGVIHEQQYNIPLATIHNSYESIPRRIQAILQTNDGPTPYYNK